MLRRRAPSLSQRFFWSAVLVVLCAMLTLGAWIGSYLGWGIARGVGETAASTLESLVASQSIDGPLSDQLRSDLDKVFEVGNNAELTRLLQIRIHDGAGRLLYQSLGGIIDATDQDALRDALRGTMTAAVLDLPLQAVGDLPRVSLPVLKIYTPLHELGTRQVIGAAELYYSARAVRAIQQRAQVDVWIIVAVVGFFAIGVLSAFIEATGAVIVQHRRALARNLLRTRRLLRENQLLHLASEELRVQANVANERVLARVGSDIHDGPLQLLTLLILRLTRNGTSADMEAAISLSTEAMGELRAISSGLVLPELADRSVGETLSLAVTRYENQTGRSVKCHFDLDGVEATTDVKVCAYRIVQECLSNAFRHGNGREVVTAKVVEEATLLIECVNRVPEVESPEDAAKARDRLGLRAMQFRIHSIGGDLAVEIGREIARVQARIPLSPSRAQSWGSSGAPPARIR